MLPSVYELELLAKERVEEGLREAEQRRLIREVSGSRKSQRGRWWPLTTALRNLLASLAAVGVDERRRRSPSTAPGLSRQSCPQEVCEA
jgi:hypothetical protein